VLVYEAANYALCLCGVRNNRFIFVPNLGYRLRVSHYLRIEFELSDISVQFKLNYCSAAWVRMIYLDGGLVSLPRGCIIQQAGMDSSEYFYEILNSKAR
jgi:hypothetical protein